MMTKTNHMKARMVLYGYTIKSLAKEMEVGEQNLAMKINGKRKFNQDDLAKIITALHYSPEELVEDFLQEDERDVC